MTHIASQVYAVRDEDWSALRATLKRVGDRLSVIESYLDTLDAQIAQLQQRVIALEKRSG